MTAPTSKSLIPSIKEKAELARERVLKAKRELDAANIALARAAPSGDVAAIAVAAERTVAAELEVQLAGDELEKINVLLDRELQSQAANTKPGSRSGQGTKTLMLHIKKKNEH